MNKKLTPRIVFIVVLILLAGWTLYPPSQTLKPGIDIAGGVSLIYEIDTHGLQDNEKKDLSQRMITVLQHRIDPANIQNLVWRPQGNTRFEVQMPLASKEAREKREAYQKAKDHLLAQNVSRSKVMQALSKPAEDRTQLFANYSQGDPNRLEMLNKLAGYYDERMELQEKRDSLNKERDIAADAVTSAGMNLDQVKSKLTDWLKMSQEEQQQAFKTFTDVNDNIPVLEGYVKVSSDWAKVADDLTDLYPKYIDSINEVDNLNLTQDQLDLALEMSPSSRNRSEKINQLKQEFPDRAAEIDKVVAAYDEYRPFRGRLDSPQDLQRMIKGSGILEFRILPTMNPEYVDVDEMSTYVERLQEKGPEYASTDKYEWCEIENIDEWHAADKKGYQTIVAQFGNKYYVLASNKSGETIRMLPARKAREPGNLRKLFRQQIRWEEERSDSCLI